MPPTVRIIVGLGNPGASYAATRHNVGFAVLDALAAEMGAAWRADKAHRAHVATGNGVLLVKPQTYMNDSGVSVGALARYFKCEPQQVLVVYDDIALPVGALRLRERGSAGGHNGMKSIIAHLGTEAFPRLRVGIGSHGSGSLVGHVLGRFSEQEKEAMLPAENAAVQAIMMLLSRGFSAAATEFNTRKKSQTPNPTPDDIPGA